MTAASAIRVLKRRRNMVISLPLKRPGAVQPQPETPAGRPPAPRPGLRLRGRRVVSVGKDFPMPDGLSDPKPVTFDLGGAPEIPFEEYVLPNGLTLLVHEDRKSPMVSVHTWFGVGSKDEPAGRTGFAHLFEHLLFKGSRAWPGSWHNTLGALGAKGINGTTNQDRTNFFQAVPTGSLDMVLAMEANRVETLLDSIDKASLEAEIGVVLNEKLQREGAPGGMIFPAMTEAFYPAGHPYAHTVLGSVADVAGADLKAVAEWHAQYYGAANSVMVLAGDVSGREGLELVERRMGGRFAGAPVRRVAEWIPPHMPNRVVLEDHVPYQQLQLTWRTPSLQSDESLKLRLFAQMLSVGPHCPFYKRFTEPGRLLSITAGNDERYLCGEFTIGAALPPGTDPARIEAELLETLRGALAGGFRPDAFARQLRANRFGDLRVLESVDAKATQLAFGKLFANDATYAGQRMARSLGFTLEDVLETAGRWLSGSPFVLRIDPFVARTHVQAEPAPPPVVTRPRPERFPPVDRFQLDNGVTVRTVHRPGAPTLDLAVLVPGRLGRETHANAGITAFAMGLATAGVEGRGKLEISELMEALGAQYGAAAGEHYANHMLSVPRGALEVQLVLLRDLLERPLFPEDEIELARARMIAEARGGRSAPGAAAGRLLVDKAYGPRHLRGVAGAGTPETLAAFTREDLLRSRDDQLAPSRTHLLLAGDLAGLDVEALINRTWGDLKGRSDLAAPAFDPIVAEAGCFAAHEQFGGQALLSGMVAKPVAGLSNAASALANHIIGGAFSSRLNAVIREEKGWTYGIGSGVSLERDRFEFGVSAMVQADKAVEALDITRSILSRTARDRDITAGEFEAAREFVGLSLTSRWPTTGAVINGLATRLEKAIPDDATPFADELAAATLDQVRDAAALMADPEPMAWVIGVDPDSPAAADVRVAGIPVLDGKE